MSVYDLRSKNLIRLSGLEPERDIRISFSGLRPGEKLVEELIRCEESVVATEHERIKVFAGSNPAWAELAPGIEALRSHCRSRDESRLLLTIMDLVPEYRPDAQLLERLLPAAGEVLRHPSEHEDLRRLLANLGTSVLAFERQSEVVHEA